MEKKENKDSKLLIEKAKLKEQIFIRLKIGKKLIGQKISSPQEKDDLWKLFIEWDYYNLECLKHAFDIQENTYANNYKRNSGLAGYASFGDYKTPTYEELFKSVKEEIKFQYDKLERFYGIIDLLHPIETSLQSKLILKDKIFISHSSNDLKFVELFVDNILKLGLNIQPDKIFCSSMEGHGVKSGEYIPDRLRSEINLSSIALLFISKNYKLSEICLNEVGAAWAVLPKQDVIPLILPDIDFNQLGVLNVNKYGIEIFKRNGIIKLVEDCKSKLNKDFKLELLNAKIDYFISEITRLNLITNSENKIEVNTDNEFSRCFDENLYPFNEIIRKSIPSLSDGIHQIKDKKRQSEVLIDLSNSNFLETLWYKMADGDFYVKSIKKIPNGNWLISIFNWEIKISDMWLSMNSEFQYEFILIKSEGLSPFIINSEIGGESFNVGILNDGLIVSENERINGYATINGETINLYEHGVKQRYRENKTRWIFLVTPYHKLGNNAKKTIEFCKKLDSGEISVNEINIQNFQYELENHPIVSKWR